MSVSPLTCREFLTSVVPATPPIANCDALVAKFTIEPAPALVNRLIVCELDCRSPPLTSKSPSSMV